MRYGRARYAGFAGDIGNGRATGNGVGRIDGVCSGAGVIEAVCKTGAPVLANASVVSVMIMARLRGRPGATV
ncbi:hypothetical protein DWV00_21590 [Trinickia dinghuensis]|uniref:Uncharacterized protein n=1 Tax=Trinickia dinghuensis TaxID=2291023 RepID=A0A3D8JUW2_9BURK|nr:hypothetical protein DWV00_21590 [Trinickia dinghuensis]